MRLLALPLFALLLAPMPAWAERSVAVMDLAAPPLLSNLGRSLSEAVIAEARGRALETLDGREIAERLGADRARVAKACGTQPRCLSRALEGLGVDRIIAGTFERTDTHYQVRMIHVDLASEQVVATLDRDVLIASRRLQAEVSAALPGFLAGEPEPPGTLVVTSKVPGAEVVVDGEPVGKTPDLRVSLKPGKHRVVVSAEYHLPLERFVEIRAGEESPLEARLFLAPGAGEKAAVLEPDGVEAAAPPAGLRIPPASWIALGAGALAAGGGLYFGLQAQGVEGEALDRDHDGLLDLTRARALEGRGAAQAANVLYGVAGAAVVTAALLAVLPRGGSVPGPAVALLPGEVHLVYGGRF